MKITLYIMFTYYLFFFLISFIECSIFHIDSFILTKNKFNFKFDPNSYNSSELEIKANLFL